MSGPNFMAIFTHSANVILIVVQEGESGITKVSRPHPPGEHECGATPPMLHRKQ